MKKFAVTLVGALGVGTVVLTGCGPATSDTGQSEKKAPVVKTESMDDRVADWTRDVYPGLIDLSSTLTEAGSSGATNISDLTPTCSKGLKQVHKLQKKADYPRDPALWNKALNNTEKGLKACVNGDYLNTTTYLLDATVNFNDLTASMS